MSSLVVAGDTSGSVTLSAQAVSGNTVLTLPATSGYLFSSVASGVLDVASGGTGQSSLAAVTVGTATNVTNVTQANIAAAVTPGASGDLLTSNGTAWTSATPAVGYTGLTTVLFTATGSLTLPAGITKCTVVCVGGGGGGNPSGSSSSAGGKGGVGWAFISGLSGTITITVGAGGAAGVAGGSSSFGSALTATGGAGSALTNGSSSTTGTAIQVGAFFAGHVLTTAGPISPLGLITGLDSMGGALSLAATPFSTTAPLTYMAGCGGGGTGVGGTGASGGVGGFVYVQY